MKFIRTVAILGLALALTACGSIETGNVGVSTSVGTVSANEEQPGFYFAFIRSVDEYSAKEIEIDFDNMRPKAKDNLSLADLDVSIYYATNPSKIADLAIKYSGQSEWSQTGVWYPSYNLVKSLGTEIVANEVAKRESLLIHTQREALSDAISTGLQTALNKTDPGTFTITRVVIRALNTDTTIEKSIQQVVQNQKKLESMAVQEQIAARQADVEVARANGIARANSIINNSLTREYLQHEQNQALMQFAISGKSSTVIMPAGSQSQLLIQP